MTPSSYSNNTTVVNATGEITSPGFINTHYYLWQTGYKTLASNTTLTQYFQRYGEFGPSIQHMTAKDKYLAQIAGALELANNQYISTTLEYEVHYGHGNMYSHLDQDQASLGVDTHFTFSSDMVQQARVWLQNLPLRLYEKVLKDLQAPWDIPMATEQAFHVITRAGALALRRDDLGVIVLGAKADLAMFNEGTPNLLGAEYDSVAAIILHSKCGGCGGCGCGRGACEEGRKDLV